MNDDRLFFAQRLATDLHTGQKRKDQYTAYIVHCLSVYRRILSIGCTDLILLCAAFLHDVIEDCDITPQELYSKLIEFYSHNEAACIVKLVLEVTDLKKQKYAQYKLNRKVRKEVTASTFRYASLEACILKLYDRIDNLSTIDQVVGEKGFSQIYKQESRELLRTIEDRLLLFKETKLITKALIDLRATCRTIQ